MNGSSALPVHRVFVYGTLMPGERNAHVAGTGFTAARATLAGHALYHLEPEGYPVLLPDAQAAAVHGWVYSYTPAAWARARSALDALEGVYEVPPLYTRARVVVTVGGEDVPAWAYVYVYVNAGRMQAAGASRLPGGDWTRRGVLDTSGLNS